MIYSEIYFRQRQKISIFVIFLTFIFSVFSFLMIFSGKAMPSKASKIFLKRVEITNLTPVQSTIFWQTNEKSSCSIIYGEDKKKLNKVSFDERDVINKKNEYFNHYAILRNLQSDKNYYFAFICSNQKIIRPDGEYFSFKTPKNNLNLNKFSPISGRILRENLTPVSEGVVLLTIPEKKVYPLSFLIKNAGEWLIPLNFFYSLETNEEIILNGKERALIEIFTEEEKKKTTITGSIEDLLKKNHLVVIGKQYDISNEENVLSAFDKIEINKNIFEVIYPQEGALIPGKRPLIKGLGIPFSAVYIKIYGKNKVYSSNVNVDSNGRWNYVLPEDLSLGKYSSVFISKTQKGEEIKITRNFVITGVDAFEGKVLGTATEEADLIPTTPISSPTITSSTPTPTLIVYNSPTISKIKDLGNFDGFSILIGLSFLILGFGILFVF